MFDKFIVSQTIEVSIKICDPNDNFAGTIRLLQSEVDVILCTDDVPYTPALLIPC